MIDDKKPALVISINMDKHCRRCGKKGATQNGLCLPCCSKQAIRDMRRTTKKKGRDNG